MVTMIIIVCSQLSWVADLGVLFPVTDQKADPPIGYGACPLVRHVT